MQKQCFMRNLSARKVILAFICFKKIGCIEEPERESDKENFANEIKKHYQRKRQFAFSQKNHVTRNGLIGKLHDKLTDIVKENLQVKIVPVYIGLALREQDRYEKSIRRKGFVNICFGTPLPCNTEPYKVRNAIMELSAESEYNEKTLHYNFLVCTKAKLWRKLCYEAEGKSLSMLLEILLKSLILSRIVRRVIEFFYSAVLLFQVDFQRDYPFSSQCKRQCEFIYKYYGGGLDTEKDRITGCLPLFYSFGMNICF